MRFNLSSFLQMRFNFYLMQKLGWSFTYVYVFLLVKIYFLIKRKEKHKIAVSIQSVFENHKNPTDIKFLKKAVYRGIFAHYYEKIINAFSPAETLRSFFETHVELEGKEALDQALAGGKGVLLVTGHFGGVEYMPLYLGFQNYPVSMVVRFTSEKLRSMSLDQAAKFGIEIIDSDQTPNMMKAIIDSLKRNRIVITQCDEIDEWRPSRQDKIYFLGKQTFLDKTLNVLSKRAAAPVVFGVMHRSDNHRYKFMATSWESMSRQFKRSAHTPMAEVLLKFLERYIYIHPEEWYQWKKYPAIETVPAFTVATPLPSSAPLLEPSFSEAA
ncbi:MAG: lysophospholipid acyltransferase family protein [Desulfobacterales bacterium]|nr:lysophospholipid acyltransferase family protein [Desulfobacterales bacterium]